MFALLASALWLLLCWTLSAHWLTNQQYSFGLLVPGLALFLLWKRWDTRPRPTLAPAWARPMVVGMALLFTPLWLVAQPNPEWRLLGWALSLVVCTLVLGVFLLGGGKPWARHFAFPVFFTLSAVPWPSALEIPVVQGLMRLVAGLSADILNFIGIAAVAAGSVMELKNGTLGVDEACSGVRSLQSSLMAALFLGELYLLGLGRRLWLVGLAGVLAFLCNIGRAVFLASQVSAQGIGAIARYHDPAGFTIMTICFVLVWLVAMWMGRNQVAPRAAGDVPAAYPVPRLLTFGLASWLALSFLGVEWWYRHDAPKSMPSWTFVLPEKRDGFRALELPADTLTQMAPDAAQMGAWPGSGSQWLAFYFRWQAGTGRSRILAMRHKPEGCLPATGWTLVEERNSIEVRVGEVVIPFRVLTFAKGTDRAHVYFCVWQDTANGKQPTVAENPRSESLRLVASHERALGQQILEIVLAGPADGHAADEAFRREIEPLLVEKRL